MCEDAFLHSSVNMIYAHILWEYFSFVLISLVQSVSETFRYLNILQLYTYSFNCLQLCVFLSYLPPAFMGIPSFFCSSRYLDEKKASEYLKL